MSTHYYDVLGIPMKDQLSVENHGTLGFMPAVGRHMKSILNKKYPPADKNNPPDTYPLRSNIASFEWMANVHELFNATLMNMDMLVSWHNIDRYDECDKICFILFHE